MTDEQFGRAWCELVGRHPRLMPECDPAEQRWEVWHYTVRNPIVWAAAAEGEGSASVVSFDTTADAYAAVGAALRKVLALADEVRALEVSQ